MAQLCSSLLIATLISSLFASPSFAETPDTPNSEARVESTTDDYGTPKTIGWSKLAPENGKPFNDPFSKLSSDQLANVSYVVRVRRLIAEEKIEADGADAIEAAKIARALKDQNIEVGWLMSQRDRVKQIRGLQIEAVAKSVEDSLKTTTITINGYATPIRNGEGKILEILVMPTSAMCSHSSSPSPLQVISVKWDEKQEVKKPGTPVIISGSLIAKSKTTPLLTANGVQPFTSAYQIVPSKIRVLQTTQLSLHK